MALAGRKTYALAGAVVSATLVLLFLGRLTPEAALAIALVAGAGFSASFRSVLEAHHAETLKVLQDVAALGQAAATRNVGMMVAAGVTALQDGCEAAEAIQQGAQAKT